MKKFILIILILLALVGCSSDNSRKVVDEYLLSLKSQNYEEAKKNISNEQSFFSVKEFGDAVYEGFTRVGLQNFDDDTKLKLEEMAKKYIEKAVEKAMDFDYKIIEESGTKEDKEVFVELKVLDSEKFKEIEDSIFISLDNLETQEEKAEALEKQFSAMEKKLEEYNTRVTKEITFKLVRENGKYKIDNGVEINDILIEPFAQFVEIFSK